MNVTVLPRTVLSVRETAELDRETRKRGLSWLAAEGVNGLHPVEAATVSLLAAALASPSLTAREAVAKWADYLAEADRLAVLRDSDADCRGLDEDMCREDEAAALDDLLDGTDTYRGTR